MRFLFIAIAAILLPACNQAPLQVHSFDGERVVLEGYWRMGKGHYIECRTEPKDVHVINSRDTRNHLDKGPYPLYGELIRVSAVLHWHGNPANARPDWQSSPSGYYLDWAQAKWQIIDKERIQRTPQ